MRTTIGYHASHEQFSPSDLLEHTRHAERAGFGAAMCSDHLFPWSAGHQEGVGFAYAWLGAALQATSLSMGVVSAPGQRYHPVVLAQACATLAQMYPGRFWVALGSGEYVNEHVTGEPWPDKPVRQARLLECAQIMRALWRGETVNHDGLVKARNARVYTTAARPPEVFAAAVSPETAFWAGGWADGLITVSSSVEQIRRVVEAFAEGGGDDKPMRLQYHLSWAPDPDQATAQAYDQWRYAALGAPLPWELELPEHFDAATATVRPEDLTETVPASHDPQWHADRLAQYLDLGFDHIMLHNVGPNQREFIDVFADKVLPQLTS